MYSLAHIFSAFLWITAQNIVQEWAGSLPCLYKEHALSSGDSLAFISCKSALPVSLQCINVFSHSELILWCHDITWRIRHEPLPGLNQSDSIESRYPIRSCHSASWSAGVLLTRLMKTDKANEARTQTEMSGKLAAYDQLCFLSWLAVGSWI